MIRPTVFGYVRATSTAQGLPHRPTFDRHDLVSFSEREGFTVAQIFTDVRDSGDDQALQALVEATTYTTIVAVVVPDWSHLGDTPASQDATHAHILETTGAPVLTARLHPPERAGAPQNGHAGTRGHGRTANDPAVHVR